MMSRLGNVERYRAENVDPLNSQVLLDGPGEAYPRVIAKTTTLHDAEKIARALNDSRGAVEALRNYGRHHPTRCARIADYTAPCDCGWSEVVDRYLNGGSS